MPLDLQSLSTDTLLYMLMHSGVFVAIMGTVFFLIGLLFGHATWGRFKTQSRLLAGEIDQQRKEIATLKRKLGEQAVKPCDPAIAIETISMEPATSDMLPADSAIPQCPRALSAEPAHDSNALVEPKIAIEPLPTAFEAVRATLDASATTSPLAAIIAPHAAAVAPKPVSESLAADVESLDIFPVLPEGPPAEVKPEIDPQLGLVYKTPPLKTDDLTALKGIAKVLEQRLHEFGIYTYEQIASWTDDQIKELSFRLAFKDRIHREKWVEQARKLLEDKKKHAL